VFLPLDEPGGLLARVETKTLIQHGGWDLIIVGAIVALAAISDHPIVVVVASLISAGICIHYGLGHGLRTLLSDRHKRRSRRVAARQAVTAWGSRPTWARWRRARRCGGVSSWLRRAGCAEEKVCPDCAETIKTNAQVCRFCGYRFAS